MRTNPFTYRILPHNKANELLDWAEKNNVEYDIWDGFLDEQSDMEIGLKDWATYDTECNK